LITAPRNPVEAGSSDCPAQYCLFY
jgi:hypothetical protein